MKEEIINIRNQAVARVGEVTDLASLEDIRIYYLGRSGKITELIKSLGSVEKSDRKEIGILINESKEIIQNLIGDKRSELKNEKRDLIDLSIPGIQYKIGKLHPTTIVINEMFDIFSHLGFSIFEGPEIETDEYNFSRLNLPKDHPARSLQDALYIEEPDVVLRTHTSSVEAPFRVVVAVKCYRFENVNASNNAMFYQFQGFALQTGLTMADLKGTLYYFVEQFFGKDRKVRYRCKYYPEVEPGVGLDLDCPFCNFKGCSVCKGRGWLEMLGAGMIHPNMIKQAGYDPKKISGFAFGIGLDRVVMDRFMINDIRSLYNGDIKYL